jgi:TRAP-type C4-dicarboxylate transport system permease large subunit
MFVIQGLSGGRPLSEIVWGSLPFGVLMLVEIVVISMFPGLVTWLPSRLVGK